MHATLTERQDTLQAVEVDISADDDASAAFSLPGRPIVALYIPTVNGSPTLTIEVSHDDGSTWASIKDDDGSTDSISITCGSGGFWISADVFTPLAAFCGTSLQMRLALSAAQNADRTFYVAAIT